MAHTVPNRQKPVWKPIRKPIPTPLKPKATARDKKARDRPDRGWKKEI